MRALISIPIFVFLIILQTSVFRHIQFLQGSSDLVLLALTGWALQRRVDNAWQWGIIAGVLVGFMSSVPVYIFLAGYLGVVFLATFVRQRLLSTSWVIMLVVVFIATIATQFLVYFYLSLIGATLPLLQSINLVILPSLLLNLLLATPFFVWMGDLAKMLNPEPLEA